VIVRSNGERVVLPTGGDRLEAGDVVALAGTPAAVEAMKELIVAGSPGGG
jgi:hypothetical protein